MGRNQKGQKRYVKKDKKKQKKLKLMKILNPLHPQNTDTQKNFFCSSKKRIRGQKTAMIFAETYQDEK